MHVPYTHTLCMYYVEIDPYETKNRICKNIPWRELNIFPFSQLLNLPYIFTFCVSFQIDCCTAVLNTVPLNMWSFLNYLSD